ncbi:tetratricopeptide repeat protein [Actinokineospora soli]|uniref:Tetratricopeptide repeat protein n=1 Tax=Actinokineospora soli TaxID=1048753 RepID=A0ABW2TPQ9_9PSEU
MGGPRPGRADDVGGAGHGPALAGRDRGGYLLRNLGEVSAAAGRDEQARRYFADAIEVRERIMDLAGAAAVRLDLASVLTRLGDPAAAREMLERAAGVFRERGMERELQDAARRLAALAAVAV